MTKQPAIPEQSSPVDWDAVERDYRAGILSVREVGRLHGVSHTAISKKAREKGWPRDLSAKIREKAKAEVAKLAVSKEAPEPVAKANARAAKGKTPVSTAPHPSEKEIVESNAQLHVATEVRHRGQLGRLNTLAARLTAKLEALLDALDQPELPPDYMAMRSLLLGERESPADLLEKLSRCAHRLIPLERQAYGMVDPDGSQPQGDRAPLGQRLKAFASETTIEQDGEGKVVSIRQRLAGMSR